jgi:hypothetical protein
MADYVTGMRPGLVPGRNVDKLNIDAGLSELQACGYTDARTNEVVAYALRRWMRGEEREAERGAIDQKFYGVSYTSWLRILAAAKAKA